ncbi:MAG: alpha amylase C-terminal domain-containing protein [Clostridiales bacterium]|nr:alpha amylase C-terminal domain-containing protein [Clostridiales bacterium]
MYQIFVYNPQLVPYVQDIQLRMDNYTKTRQRLLGSQESLSDFANAHLYFGIHHTDDGWVYREWAPAAEALHLLGEFNDWNPASHPMTNLGNGVWELVLPGKKALWQGCRVKTMVTYQGKTSDHIPLYAQRVVQDKETLQWCAEVVDDKKKFRWADKRFKPQDPPLIYEAHVGMAQEEERVGTYREFADLILPRIKADGYNTIQLMAIMEHPYYGSFGYQVSNFFAASSWFGTPEDLKYLVNTAHKMGIRVLLDLIHSHAVKNTAEGINEFDGTTWQFFHDGPKGDHPAWGTKLFNYGKTEVLHFLLSNLKFWMEEFHFDGFRFDGVTSMLYLDHGLGSDFDHNSKYFSMNTDTEAVTYLQLANELIHELKPSAITVAEDMSGMPGMCLPISAGGIGFDYRLGMGLPDLWIRTIKEKRDEDWNIEEIWSSICLRRPGEKTVAYVESHDQALVGDKTLMFRLADAAMYTDMDKETHNLVIDRAVALHKLIRLLTMASGGDAYLNFMGNEFGHPEWIDFPREGNQWSFKYCRRQWSLADNGFLKYQWLGDFDKAMISMAREWDIFQQDMPHLNRIHNQDHILAFERNQVLFVFNFHPTQSFTDYVIPVTYPTDYRLILSSDEKRFGGYDRIADMQYSAYQPGMEGNWLKLYLPARTAAVLVPVFEDEPKKTTRRRKKAATEKENSDSDKKTLSKKNTGSGKKAEAKVKTDSVKKSATKKASKPRKESKTKNEADSEIKTDSKTKADSAE